VSPELQGADQGHEDLLGPSAAVRTIAIGGLPHQDGGTDHQLGRVIVGEDLRDLEEDE
jgi:hypothetical protein